jgi:valyl-tRNA synthetase
LEKAFLVTGSFPVFCLGGTRRGMPAFRAQGRLPFPNWISKVDSMRLAFGLREENWQPQIEEAILSQWIKEKLYAFEPKTTKPIFSVDTPPPYLSGPWHVGSAIHYAQIDMIARTKRMEGFAVIFPMGLDRNGLPIEVQVEKHYKVNMHEVPRQKFLDMCAEFLDRNERLVVALAQRLGLSCNSFETREMYRTDSPEYRAVTQRTFIDLYQKGLVYVDERPNNWCPVCGTTIADAEVEYKDLKTKLTTLRFTVAETKEELQVATTRPELLGACAAILVNPEDKRYSRLHRKTAVTPLYGARVPILPHQEARIDFGTGAVMVCSYGDYTDVRLFRDLQLQPINAIGPDGKMAEVTGPYAGMGIAEARLAILEDLKARGLIIKQEAITHRTPTCWRSQNPIEFIAMPEYYLRQTPFVDDLRRVTDQITFFPAQHRQILLDWLDSVTRDWPISRRRYYGTEIPLWYCKECGTPYVPPPGVYYQPWRTPPPVKACPKCGARDQFEGEQRTMDTWMDSSISPLITIGYAKDDDLFHRAFPCSIRPQGKDIVRTWLYYTLLRVYQLFKAPAFKYVWISGHGLDERGEAMHKSRGNIIDPVPIIAKYGSDAFRLWGCLEASVGSDIRFSEGRLGGANRFLVKLWNIARFISAFPQVEEKDVELQAADRWILSELNKVIQRAREGYSKLDFHIPALELRTFTWELFASHYVELVKGRAYSEGEGPRQKAAWYTLHAVLSAVLKLLAPICPFIADKLHRSIYVPNASIHLLTFPDSTPEWQTTHPTEAILQFNAEVWKYKKDHHLSLRDPLHSVTAPSNLKPYGDDLIRMHNIKELRCAGKGKAKIQPAK